MSEMDFINGQRSTWLSILRTALKELGHDAPEVARMVLEREETVLRLRKLCEEFGDNEWPEDLHLADVIDKHVGFGVCPGCGREFP